MYAFLGRDTLNTALVTDEALAIRGLAGEFNESYLINDLESLQEEVNKYHPIF